MDNPANWFDKAYQKGFHLQHWETHGASPELLALVAAGVLRPEMRVLDIGCGTGREAIYMASLGCTVTGIDFSGAGLEIARQSAKEQGVDVSFVEASALAIPSQDDSVDFVNDRGCLHHIPEAKRELYSSETRRVLRAGGLLFLRGARDANGTQFVPITQESLTRNFPAPLWERGPITELATMSEQKILPARMVILRKTE